MNPIEKTCFRTCPVCYKCADRGRVSGTSCSKCPGRNDPMNRFVYDDRVICDCRNGVLRHMTQDGRLIVRNFPTNPFANRVVADLETQDERDWQAYVHAMREYYDDPYWDPIKFNDGTGTTDWTRQQREGM